MNLAYLRHLARLGAADIHPWGAAGTAALLAALDLQPGMRVVELGCGTGQSLRRLAAGRQMTVVGVELLPEMLAAARERLAGEAAAVGLVRGRGEWLPLAANSVDRVVTESVLGFQDTATAQRMLAEIWRALRPGGLYVANEAVWRAGVPAEVVQAINERSLADFGVRHAADAVWTAVEWRQAMAAAGFEVLAADVMQPEPLPASEAGRQRALYTWRGWLHPGLLWQRWLYRRRLRRHAGMAQGYGGEVIEGRLFVARKGK